MANLCTLLILTLTCLILLVGPNKSCSQTIFSSFQEKLCSVNFFSNLVIKTCKQKFSENLLRSATPLLRFQQAGFYFLDRSDCQIQIEFTSILNSLCCDISVSIICTYLGKIMWLAGTRLLCNSGLGIIFIVCLASVSGQFYQILSYTYLISVSWLGNVKTNSNFTNLCN